MSPTILQNETAGGFSTFQVQDSVHPITAILAPKAAFPHGWEEAQSSNLSPSMVPTGETPSLHIFKGCPRPPAHFPPHPPPLLHDPRDY